MCACDRVLVTVQSLRSTQNALSVAQKQVSTGYKIGGAEDNASTWSIAETMKSDKAALSTIADSLAESSSILNVANAAVKSAISVMNDIKSALVQAQQPGADLAYVVHFGHQAKFRHVPMLQCDNARCNSKANGSRSRSQW